MASANYKYSCGTPTASCSGSTAMLPKGCDSIKKIHQTPEQAFKCHERYLLSQGYEKTGSREYKPPGGGPYLVLTKKTRFGGKFRNGKKGEKSGTGGNRNVAQGHGAGLIAAY